MRSHKHIIRGFLKGNIKSLNTTIGGDFEGDVFADTLAIESTAKIKGNLHYNNLKAQVVQHLMFN